MKGVSGLKAGHSKVIYFITDALGTVRDVVDSLGVVKASYEFDPDGRKISPPNTEGVESPKTWIGGLSVNDDMADAGLYLMGHRFYDPSLSRFLNRDPIGFAGGLNLYEYAASSPVSAVDPEGLQDSVRAGIASAIRSGNLVEAAALTKEMVSFYGVQATGAAGAALYHAQAYINQAWSAAQRGMPNCTQVAEKLFEAFKAAGGNPEYVKLTSNLGGILHRSNMNLSIGQGNHYAVLYQGRIYDAFVGLQGVPSAQYANQFVGEGLKWVRISNLP